MGLGVALAAADDDLVDPRPVQLLDLVHAAQRPLLELGP
jgi:hypothetical protein